jgi:hypothetical protein
MEDTHEKQENTTGEAAKPAIDEYVDEDLGSLFYIQRNRQKEQFAARLIDRVLEYTVRAAQQNRGHQTRHEQHGDRTAEQTEWQE